MLDLFGRELSYVRISVTDRCNYRCRYCMPEDGVEWIPHEKILSYEDFFFLIGALEKLGARKIRFTGGEPLVRKGMLPFISEVCASFPHIKIAITTNGSTLTRHSEALASMPLGSINISLDTLSHEKFASMTRGARLQDVLDGIDALIAALPRTGARPKVKMNSVLIRGYNDDSLAELADFAFQRGITPRFIEFMPVEPRLWSEDTFLPFKEAMDILSLSPDEWKEEPESNEQNPGPARYYVNAAANRRIGFILAVSRHFCARCNRLRVTSTGDARPCLFGNEHVPLLDVIRARDEEGLRARLLTAAAMKPETGMGHGSASMNKIGG